jgi:alkanesulfonate monooxygenase SsuD/methylene tetrahydromethanopterin reductase-like flavin-dependent oxidoreductase (luciferase family)
MPRPIADIDTYWTPAERAHASGMLACSFVGSRETVRRGVAAFVARTGVDELIVSTATYDHAARLRSYEILAELLIDEVPVPAGVAPR